MRQNQQIRSIKKSLRKKECLVKENRNVVDADEKPPDDTENEGTWACSEDIELYDPNPQVGPKEM